MYVCITERAREREKFIYIYIHIEREKKRKRDEKIDDDDADDVIRYQPSTFKHKAQWNRIVIQQIH